MVSIRQRECDRYPNGTCKVPVLLIYLMELSEQNIIG